MSEHPVRVGILDTGLVVPVKARREFRDTNEPMWPAPSANSHGNRLAAIVLRYCPSVDLYDARALGEGRPGTVEHVASALSWLVEHGADIVNMSFGLRGDTPVLAGAIDGAARAGCLLVASAPAAGAPVFPARYPGVLAVTGDARCAAGMFAAYQGDVADFGAPPGGPAHTAHTRGAGASFACAHVSGMLAQLINGGCQPADAASVLRHRCTFSGRECLR